MDPLILIVVLVVSLIGGAWVVKSWQDAARKSRILSDTLDRERKQLTENSLELAQNLRSINELKAEIKGLQASVNQGKAAYRQKELERLNFELSPHAFKNTLNTIQSLSLKTNMAVTKLTNLLDYMLYEVQENSVPLKKEVAFLQEFIALNKLMMPVWVKIELDNHLAEEALNTLSIAPLITVYFAENAFKHADTSTPESFIKFQVESPSDSKVVYRVANRLPAIRKKSAKSGIGSSNLERRLELLYPDKHQLKMEIIGDMYISELTLELT